MVELVVQCIRASDVPQTHHHALLLLGTAATIFPVSDLCLITWGGDQIGSLTAFYSPGKSAAEHHAHLHLHGLQHHASGRRLQLQSHQQDGRDGHPRPHPGQPNRMLTRVTSSLIRPEICGDSYLTVNNLRLQARRLSDDSSSHVDAVVTRIIHVFTDALPHVPEHRRLPVLVQLVMTLGPAHFLWVLMLLLFKLHATHTASATSEKVTRRHPGGNGETVSRIVNMRVGLCRTQHWRRMWTSGSRSAPSLRSASSSPHSITSLVFFCSCLKTKTKVRRALRFLWRKTETTHVRSPCVRRGVEARHRPASSPEEERGEDGGADLQRGGSQQQRAATLQVHQRVLHGAAARLGQLYREGERRSAHSPIVNLFGFNCVDAPVKFFYA